MIVCANLSLSSLSTSAILTLSLHDALPISIVRFRGTAGRGRARPGGIPPAATAAPGRAGLGIGAAPGRHRRQVPLDRGLQDRKSTRLNSSHGYISYAVFCLKKKKL